MAQDRNGNNHKAAGRPDGGQFDKKAGQGSDDDLDFEAADTRLSAAMPDMDAEDRRRLINVVIGGLDEDDPVAVAGYLDSLDPGVRFILSDKARALEARTLDDPDWCDAHAEELMAAVPDIGSGALTGVIHYWRADDPDASDRLAEAVTDDPDIADELCYERAVSDRLFRQRKPWASRDRLLENPHLTEAQRSALTTPIPESGFTRANDQKTLRAMLFASDEQYRAHVVARNGDLVHADPELEDLVRTDPSDLVRGYLGDACERCGAPLEDGGSECAQCHRTVCGNCSSRCAYCGEAACDDCGMYCAGCHRWFCGMHLTSGRCPSCA